MNPCYGWRLHSSSREVRGLPMIWVAKSKLGWLQVTWHQGSRIPSNSVTFERQKKSNSRRRTVKPADNQKLGWNGQEERKKPETNDTRMQRKKRLVAQVQLEVQVSNLPVKVDSHGHRNNWVANICKQICFKFGTELVKVAFSTGLVGEPRNKILELRVSKTESISLDRWWKVKPKSLELPTGNLNGIVLLVILVVRVLPALNS